MIDGLQPYPAYKETFVPWIGKVPAHWVVAALRHRYEQCLGKMLDSARITGNHLIPYLRNVDVQWDRINTSNLPIMDVAPEEYARYTVQPGDLLVCEGGDVGRCAIWNGELKTCGFQKALHRLRPLSKHDSCRFLYFWFLAGATAGALDDGNESTIAHLTGDKLRAHRFASPPADEQHAIARFLDHVGQRIRRYVRAKKKLIVLLSEQKQSVIDHAVTRGLDANARLKASGVEWLGDVPEHWVPSSSRRLFSVRTELARATDVQLSATQAYGVIPQLEFEERVGRKVVRVSMHLDKRRHVERDDFVISMRSFQGGLERAWAAGAIRSSYVVLKPDPRVHVGYFACLFKSRGYIGALQATADFIRDGQDLTFDNFCRVDLPLLPFDEQGAIARFIAEATARVDASISRLIREINLLGELKARLVADVVTGKLDVREAASHLPRTPSTSQDDGLLAEDTAASEAANLDGDIELGMRDEETLA